MTRAATLVGALLLGGATLAGTAAAIPIGGIGEASSPHSERLADVHDVQILVLKDTCGDACQADTMAQAKAAGCDRMRLFPTLRMASMRCESAGRGVGMSSQGVARSGFDPSRLPGVESASPDAIVNIGTSARSPDDSPAADNSTTGSWEKRKNATVPWGLDRINQRSLPLDGRVNTPCYPARGAGVTVYVVDSGITATHPEFGGRAIGVVPPGAPFDTAEDLNGHGSHVAGTVAGRTTGVAPAATVVGVRGGDENGNASFVDLLSGIEYVADIKASNPQRKIVVNLSFGGNTSYVRPWTIAATRAAEVGVIVAAAAGNEPVDACRNHPSRAPGILSVAALTPEDELAPFSARGTECIAVGAPGVDVLSVDGFRPETGGLIKFDGTSMASPHVAGLAALILAEDPRGAELSGDEVLSRMTRAAPIVGGYPLAWANPNCAGLAGAPTESMV